MTRKILEWDSEAGCQVERNATPAEEAAFDALAAAAALPKIPKSVPRKAARLALLNAGKFHLVQPAIDALDEPDRTFVQIEWDDSLTFERDSSTLLLLAGAIGIDSDGLDQLFIAAEALQ